MQKSFNDSDNSEKNQDFDDDFYNLRDEFYGRTKDEEERADFLQEGDGGEFYPEEDLGDLEDLGEEEIEEEIEETPLNAPLSPSGSDRPKGEADKEVFRLIGEIEERISALKGILGGSVFEQKKEETALEDQGERSFDFEEKKEPQQEQIQSDGSKIIEGVFDGQNMIGPDGKQYSVPANYASKSKLLEGDILKLTITPQGRFIYKQISPVERQRAVARLARNEEGDFLAVSENRNKAWRLLPASVSYFRGDVGDEAVIFIPEKGNSTWAAVENIVKK